MKSFRRYGTVSNGTPASARRWRIAGLARVRAVENQPATTERSRSAGRNATCGGEDPPGIPWMSERNATSLLCAPRGSPRRSEVARAADDVLQDAAAATDSA